MWQIRTAKPEFGRSFAGTEGSELGKAFLSKLRQSPNQTLGETLRETVEELAPSRRGLVQKDFWKQPPALETPERPYIAPKREQPSFKKSGQDLPEMLGVPTGYFNQEYLEERWARIILRIGHW